MSPFSYFRNISEISLLEIRLVWNISAQQYNWFVRGILCREYINDVYLTSLGGGKMYGTERYAATSDSDAVLDDFMGRIKKIMPSETQDVVSHVEILCFNFGLVADNCSLFYFTLHLRFARKYFTS
uniref:Uncharacterized protein n=1 Tax=Parascaris equorum TaxID=6256 RepID=A0A914R0Y6_PAREQ